MKPLAATTSPLYLYTIRKQGQTSHLLQGLTDEFIPFASTHHDAKSIQLSAWSPIGAVKTSMVVLSEHLLSSRQQFNKRPITDSGYAGSQKSRRIELTTKNLVDHKERT